MKQEFDGKIDNKEVKNIVRTNEKGEIMYCAKPINKDVMTPDFREFQGSLIFHQDLADDKFYQKMIDTRLIGSVEVQSGQTFFSSCGYDVMLLPKTEVSDGYVINTSASGVLIKAPVSDWWLMVFGILDSPKPKT